MVKIKTVICTKQKGLILVSIDRSMLSLLDTPGWENIIRAIMRAEKTLPEPSNELESTDFIIRKEAHALTPRRRQGGNRLAKQSDIPRLQSGVRSTDRSRWRVGRRLYRRCRA